MLHRVVLKPERMLSVLPQVDEGLFVIRCPLLKKTYQVILYKYNEDYFLLRNPYLVHLLLDKSKLQLSNAYLLGLIEQAMEANHYQMTTKEWVALDLNTLRYQPEVEIEMFSFGE